MPSRQRIQDAECNVLITGDGSWRRGKTFPLKDNADIAVAECPSIDNVIVVKRTDDPVEMDRGQGCLVPRPHRGSAQGARCLR